jgi:putative oxidoreductase
MRLLERFSPLGGRVLLSLIFLAGAYWKIKYWAPTVEMLDLKGIPTPAAALAVATILELAGGLALLVGFKARFAALALFVYVVPVTLVMHSFLGLEGAERQDQTIHFMKNVAIMGGLLMVTAAGSGPFSVDARLEGLAD